DHRRRSGRRAGGAHRRRRSDGVSEAGMGETVTVGLGDRSYDIVIAGGLIAGAGAMMAERYQGARAFIVTDRNVASFHLKTLENALDGAGVAHDALVLEPGEGTKS